MLLAHVLSKCSIDNAVLCFWHMCFQSALQCCLLLAAGTLLRCRMFNNLKRCLWLHARTLRRCRLLQHATISCAVACSGTRQCHALSQCRHGFEPVFDMHAQTLLRSRICMNVPSETCRSLFCMGNVHAHI